MSEWAGRGLGTLARRLLGGRGRKEGIGMVQAPYGQRLSVGIACSHTYRHRDSAPWGPREPALGKEGVGCEEKSLRI